MDGDGVPEIVFSRGSTRGGPNAPALFVMEGNLLTVGIEDPGSIPASFELSQNYPNPFNPETRIAYSLAKATRVNLTIYNLLGQEVRTLVDGFREAKLHTVTWNAKDNKGLEVPSGLYFYRLQTEDYTKTVRMLLIR
jgi:hypothetical protein